MAARKPFFDLVRERVVVLDGAMGSNLQQRTFDLEKDWLGQENISEVLNFTRPEVIQEIHELFLAVGCDAVETNTFGANKIVMAEADMADRVYENNVAACHIARAACDKYETPDSPKYVVGALGGGTKLLSLGMTDWATAEESYYEQIRGLIDGGADVLLFETQQDLLIIKSALVAAERAMTDCGRRLDIVIQASMDQDNGNQMLTGSDATALVAAIAPYEQVKALGLNCAFGPIELMDSVRTIANTWPRYVSCLPNAGMPIMIDGRARFPMTPPDFAKGISRMVNEFGVGIVGGCCGTMPEHLKAVVDELQRAAGLRPASHTTRTVAAKDQVSSLYSAEDIRQDKSYLIVAERTNTNGSRQFKRLLQEGDIDGLVSMARDEVRDGSHMLDLCVDFVGRDGVADMKTVASKYVVSVHSPLMIDSTDPRVLEAGLQLAGGRCAINSMNLEEGEEKLGQICQLAKKYGAAVVAGTIDEDKENAMARTRERKLAIAQRIRDISVNQHGLRDGDLMFDPLVLPISTGIEEDRRNAMETIEGTRLISQHLPDCHTVVGLSNVSFGLKPTARVVLNSAFLHELREAGLTGAIVHASKILPKNRIPEQQWNAALDLIYDRRREGVNGGEPFDPLTAYIELFPDAGAELTVKKADPFEGLSVEDALKKHIIDGEKRGLTDRLTEAMKTHPPLKIINDILLDGMKVVGDLFGRGEMQLPFVLQSAETMKASVAHLEPFMEKAEGSSKGKIVLATVRGDVHDIGKNLVDIILSNNGYTVYNLGIKQPVADILKAAEEKKADAVGMSGLLVKSVAVMRENLEEMNARGVTVPVLLGGAALTRDYAEDDLASLYGGPLLYCRDAFDGLKVMDSIAGNKIAEYVGEQQARAAKRKTQRANAVKPKDTTAANVAAVAKDNPVPTPPFWGRRVVTGIKPGSVFSFINETALFTGQWGFKRKGMEEDAYERFLDDKARPVFEDLKRRANAEGFIDPKVVYGYFPVQADGDDLVVYDPTPFIPGHEVHGAANAQMAKEMAPAVSMVPSETPKELLRFGFPRQSGRRLLCISDFYRTVSSGQYDVLALQLVTVGDKSTELAEALRAENCYQDYLYLHGFGVECAEALAEFWHKR
ncbi:MAG TPA: methionine synthase, partial [Tepidisphaeraceae bacterium]